MKILINVGLVFLLCIAFACKKDSDKNQQLLLSKVFEDGLLIKEYLYDNENRPYRLNSFSVVNGQSQPGSYKLYSYNSDGLLEYVNYYNAQNQFNYRYRLLYDANKRNVRMDFLNSNDNLISYYLMEYNTDNKVVRYEFRNGGSNQIGAQGLYTYNEAGGLVKIIRNNFVGGNMIPGDSTTYEPGPDRLPTHWNFFESLVLVGLPIGDSFLLEMFIEYSEFYRTDAPPQIVRKTFSERNYNSSGYLVRQQLELESIYLVTEDVVYDMTYEYISPN